MYQETSFLGSFCAAARTSTGAFSTGALGAASPSMGVAAASAFWRLSAVAPWRQIGTTAMSIGHLWNEPPTSCLVAANPYSSVQRSSLQICGSLGTFSSTRAASADRRTVRGQVAYNAEPTSCASTCQQRPWLPKQLVHSCQSAAALSIISLIGSSGVCTVLKAECLAMRRSHARCSAATSRCSAPSYRIHQSTGALGNCSIQTRNAPSWSACPWSA
mmetsp:Transcript_149994/g.264708  ORF Transcript_149994/g.264708 Transcript_149994/m.264708 type:complete len:217 (+) Transcript_149994:1148-1798(+)